MRRAKQAARQHRQTVLGAASLGVVVVFGVIALVFARQHEAAAADELARAAKLGEELLAVDISTPTGQAHLRQRAEQTASIWRASAQASAIQGRLEQMERATAQQQAQAAAAASVAQVEQGLQSAGSRADWDGLAATTASLRAQARTLPKELQTRLAELEAKVADGRAGALAAAALSIASTAPAAEALAACQQAEEAILNVLAGQHAPGTKAPTAQLQQLEAVEQQTDAIAARLADAAAAANPWQELTQAQKQWRASHTKGFAVTFAGDGVLLDGPAMDEHGNGMVTVRRGAPIRDCDLEFAFQLDSGAATVLLRLGKHADAGGLPAIRISTTATKANELAVTASQAATVHVRLLGSTLDVRGEGGARGAFRVPVKPMARAGDLAIATTPGTRLHIQRLSLRELP